MAGLLTDSSFPMPSHTSPHLFGQCSGNKFSIGKSTGVSQQRDCSGFTPDSLFIRFPNREPEQNAGKDKNII